jgi:hypothetical protein
MAQVSKLGKNRQQRRLPACLEGSGANLNGWRNTAGGWHLDKGLLIGKGDQASLRTERADFADFHLFLEAKYVRGDARILIREQDKVGKAYAVFMSSKPGGFKTGALTTYLAPGGPTSIQDKEVTKPDEWFTLEVIARGNQLETRVNGVRMAQVEDANKNFMKGFLRLVVSGKDAELHVKKIEIKELPPLAASANSDKQRILHFEGIRQYVDIPTLGIDPVSLAMGIMTG